MNYACHEHQRRDIRKRKQEFENRMIKLKLDRETNYIGHVN